MLERLQARVQYGDWRGTAAADEHGADNAFDELFEATGQVDPEKEIMIGFAFSLIEGSVSLAGYFHPKPETNTGGWYPSLNEEFKNNRTSPIPVKKVKVEITREQFFKYFKRFKVVLVDKALDIGGRDIEVTEDDKP